MSKELIERLRSNFPTTQAQWEAADRIEELEHKLACAEYESYMRQEECEIARDELERQSAK